MSVPKSSNTYPDNFEKIYKSADENTRGAFRARKSWLIRNKNYSEQEAISKAFEVFNRATTSQVKPIKSECEPSYQEIANVVEQLQNSATVLPFRESNEDSCTVDQIISKPEGIQDYFRKHKYDLLKLTLYALIVPITVQVIHTALSKTGMHIYMTWTISIVLALATDYIAIDHISKVRSLRTGAEQINIAIALFILFANLTGAYLLFEKEIKLDQLSVISSQRLELKKEVDTKLQDMTKAKTTYLLNKWPESKVDRETCESNRVPDCGPMFAKQSRPFEAKYLTAKQLYEHKKTELEKLPTIVPQAQAKTEFWWHFGYYVFIWLLLASVIRMEKLSQA